MDRFGITASVTYHTEAKDLNPLYGNRKLMADIDITPGTHCRIIPCFVIAPAMLYREGELKYVIDHLAKGIVRAVTFFPKTSRCAVREIEKVLVQLEPYKPVVLLDAWEMKGDGDYRDLQDIAQTFPNITFIIQQAMWWQFSLLADLMWRCVNIRVGLSQFHFRDAIKTVIANFGEERLLFGLGPKSHGGAALAALMYANIDETNRESIACGNIKKLLELDLAAVNPMTGAPINDLWERFMDGKGLPSDILAIDAHSHIGPPARGWYIPQVEIDNQISIIDRELTRFGIQHIISCPEPAQFAHPIEGNTQVETSIAQYGAEKKRFLGYFVYNPHFADEFTELVLNDFFSRDYFVGFKIMPEYWHISLNDPVFEGMWQYAHKYCLPILIHTWDKTCGTARMIEDIAPRYPDAIFLLGHSGGGDEGRLEAVEMAQRFDNVILEWCGSFTSSISWEDTIRQVGAHKVIYGTDTFFHDIAWELGRLLSLDLSLQEFKRILGENAAEILGKRRNL